MAFFFLNELQAKSWAKDVCVDIRFTFRARIVSMRKLCTELHAYIIYESTALIHCWIRQVLKLVEKYKKNGIPLKIVVGCIMASSHSILNSWILWMLPYIVKRFLQMWLRVLIQGHRKLYKDQREAWSNLLLSLIVWNMHGYSSSILKLSCPCLQELVVCLSSCLGRLSSTIMGVTTT